MFRLIKLEDRIVLDGAGFADVMNGPDFDDAYMMGDGPEDVDIDQPLSLDDLAATVADADFGRFEDGDDTDDYSAYDMFVANTDEAREKVDGVRVLVIASNVDGGEQLETATKDGVLVVKASVDMTPGDLSQLITKALTDDNGEMTKADSIAFATHTLDFAGEGDDQKAVFWKAVGGMVKDGGDVDLLACNAAADAAGKSDVDKIDTWLGDNVGVAASDDVTGNPSEAGSGADTNWYGEYGARDFKAIYFDSARIANFDGDLAPLTLENPFPDQSGQRGSFLVFRYGGEAYNEDSGLTYTVNSTAGWLNFFPNTDSDGSSDLIFYGTPPDINPNDLLTYDVQVTANNGEGPLADTFKVILPPTGENIPVYPNPATTIPIDEKPGTVIGEVVLSSLVATDADGDNITYSLDSNAGGTFGINPSTGAISVLNTDRLVFDPVTPSNNFVTITARATDDSPFNLSDTAIITFEIIDIPNQNPSLVTLSLSATEFNEEGTGNEVTVFAQLSDGGSGLFNQQPITVELDFTGSEADFGLDFEADPAANPVVITIPAGTNQGSVVLQGLPDLDAEGDETVSISIGDITATNSVAGTPSTVAATLKDVVSTQQAVFLSANDFEVSENNEQITITANVIGGNAQKDLTIFLNTGGTATRDLDYNLAADSIFIPKGVGSAQITLTGLPDDDDTDDGEIAVISIDTAKSGTLPPAGTQPTTLPITIIDETPPEVTLRVDTTTIYEEGVGGPTTSRLIAELAEPPDQNVTIFLETVGDAGRVDAVKNVDYQVLTTAGAPAPTFPSDPNLYTLNIPAGQTIGFFDIRATKDDLYEGDTPETVELSIFDVKGALDRGTTESVIVQIEDEDDELKPTVNIEVQGGGVTGSFAENGSINLDVKLSTIVGGDIVVTLDVNELTDSQPVLNVDYTATVDGVPATTTPGGQIIVPVKANFDKAVLKLTGIVDGVFENPELVNFDIVAADNADIGAATATVTLTNVDAAPKLSLTGPATTDIQESPAGSAIFTVGVVPDGAPVGADLIVEIQPGGDPNAKAGIDYDITGATLNTATGVYELTVPQGQTSANFTLSAIDDDLAEGDETVTLDFSAKTKTDFSNKVSGTPSSVQIIDNEDPLAVTVSFGGAPVPTAIDEATEQVSVIDVQLSNKISGGTNVILDFSNSVAKLGGPQSDYTVTLQDTSAATLILEGTATDIVSDDRAILVIDEQTTSVKLDIKAKSDALFEGVTGEIVNVQLEKSAGEPYNLAAPDTADITINEGLTAAPTVDLRVVNSTFSENGGTLQLFADLPQALEENVTVSLAFDASDTEAAVLNDDYLVNPTSITILKGQTSGFTLFVGQDDSWLEQDATISATIIAVNGDDPGKVDPIFDTADIETVTIIDDDAGGDPQIRLNASQLEFSESGVNTSFTIEMDRTAATPVNVQLALTNTSAIWGTDFTSSANFQYVSPISGVVTIPAGQQFATITLSGITDGLLEGPETFNVKANPVPGQYGVDSPDQQDFTIIDDDAITINIEFSNVTIGEGSTPVNIIASLDGGVLGGDLTVPLTFSTSAPVGADFNVDYVLGVPIAPPPNPYILIPAGDTQASIQVVAPDEGTFEPDEFFRVEIGNVTSANPALPPLNPGVTDDTLNIKEGQDAPEVRMIFETVGGVTTGPFTIIESDGGNPGTIETFGTLTVSIPSTPDIQALGQDAGIVIEIDGPDGLLYGTDSGDDFFIIGPGTTDVLDINIDANGNGTFAATFLGGNPAPLVYTVAAMSDDLIEGDEVLEFKIQSEFGTVQNTTSDDFIVTIQDQDFVKPTVGVDILPNSAVGGIEGWIEGIYGFLTKDRVDLIVTASSNPLGVEVELNFSFTSAATPGVDYEIYNNFGDVADDGDLDDGIFTIVMAPGVTQASYQLGSVLGAGNQDDDKFEGNEALDVFINVTNSVNITGAVGATGAQATIIDNEQAPIIEFANTPLVSGATEGSAATEAGLSTAGVQLVSNQVFGINTTIGVSASWGAIGADAVLWTGGDDVVGFGAVRTDGSFDYRIAIGEGLFAPTWSSDLSFVDADFSTDDRNQYIQQKDGNGVLYFFRAIEETSLDGTITVGLTPPMFDFDPGDTFTDGEVRWQNVGPVYATGAPAVGNSATVVITWPENEKSIDLIIEPVTDVTFEADEKVNLFLETQAPGLFYSVGPAPIDSNPEFAPVVTIFDDDVAPNVSLGFSEGGGPGDSIGAEDGSNANDEIYVFYPDGDTPGESATVILDFGTEGNAVYGGVEFATGTGRIYEDGDTVVFDTTGVFANGQTLGHYYYEVVGGGGTVGSAFSAVVAQALTADQIGESFTIDGITFENKGRADFFIADTLIDGSGEIVIPAGSSQSPAYTLEVIDDPVYERDETASIIKIVQVRDTVLPSAGPGQTGTYTIEDDEAVPTIGFSATEGSFSEIGTFPLRVTLSGEAAEDTIITFNISNADASVGADYTVFPGPDTAGVYKLTIPAGQTNGLLTLVGIADNIYEGSAGEQFGITIGQSFIDFDNSLDFSAGNDVVLNTDPAEFIGTVGEATAQPQVRIEVDPVSFFEASSSGTADLYARLDGAVVNEGPLTVNILLDTTGSVFFYSAGVIDDGDYVVLDTNGNDLIAGLADTNNPVISITIPDQATEGKVILSGITDNFLESDETFGVTLQTDAGYNALTTANFVSPTIIDSNPDPIVSLEINTFYQGSEGAAADPDDEIFLEKVNNIFSDTRNIEAELVVSIPFGSSIGAGSEVVVPLVLDTAGGATPGVDFNIDTTATNISFDTAASIIYVAITEGTTLATVKLTAIDDAQGFEGDETFQVSIGANITNGVADTANDQVNGTIFDSEDAPQVSIEISRQDLKLPYTDIPEQGPAAGIVTAQLDQTASTAVTVDLAFDDPDANFAAQAGVDFSTNGTQIVIPAGALSGSFAIFVSPNDDGTYEGNEDFNVKIVDVPSNNARITTDPAGLQPSIDYIVGEEVTATLGDGTTVLLEVVAETLPGTSGASYPTELSGASFDTFTVGQQFIPAGSSLTWEYKGLTDLTDLPLWDDGATVTQGELVAPGNGYYYRASNALAASTGATQPTWPTTPGSSVVDGGVTWVLQGEGTPNSEIVATIVENDQGPVFSITAPTTTIFESAGGVQTNRGFASFTVSMNVTSADVETAYLGWQDLTGEFPAVYGTAAGEDFIIATDSAGANPLPFATDVIDGDRFVEVSFGAGAPLTQTLYVVATTDLDFEQDETLALKLDRFENGGVTANSAADEATITILDDDDANAKRIQLNFDDVTSTVISTAAPFERDFNVDLNMFVQISGGSPSANDITVDLQFGGTEAAYGADFFVETGGAVLSVDTAGMVSVLIAGGQTQAEVPITIVDDNLMEPAENFTVDIDRVVNALPWEENDSLAATIGDNQNPDVYITLNTNLDFVSVGEVKMTGGETFDDTLMPTVAANGWEYRLIFDGQGTAAGLGGPGTAGLTIMDGNVDAGDHVENGAVGPGLYWKNVGTFLGDYPAGGVPGLINNGDAYVLEGKDGNEYVFVVEGGPGGVSGPPPAGGATTVIGDTQNLGGGVTWRNVGYYVGDWEQGATYEQDTVITFGAGAGATEVAVALDDGTSNVASTDLLPDADGEILRDGDANQPLLWEAVAPVTEGTIDETDGNQVGQVFVVRKTTVSNEPVQVDYAVSTASDAILDIGQTTGSDYFLAATDGTINLGFPANVPQFITLTTPGDEVEETGTATLSVKIDEVRWGTTVLPDNGEYYPTAGAGDSVDIIFSDTFEPDVTPTLADGLNPNALGISEGVFAEDASVGITASYLFFTDADTTNADDLTLTVVTVPTAGSLYLDGGDNLFDGNDDILLTQGDELTMQQISNGDFWYDHTGGEERFDKFTFVVDDGANTSFFDQTAGTPWTFTFGATAENDAPQVIDNVLHASELYTGVLFDNSILTTTAGPLAVDSDTPQNLITYTVRDDDGNWVPVSQGAPGFDVNASGQLITTTTDALDYEANTSITLNIRASDGTATDEGFFVVRLQDAAELGGNEFDTGVTISNQFVTEGETFIFEVPDEVFRDARMVTYDVIDQNPGGANLFSSDNGSGGWLWFNTETLTFVYDPDDLHFSSNVPNSDVTFTVTINAVYYDDTLVQKGSVTKTFSMTFATVASLELDMLMDALNFLEEDEGIALPEEGGAVNIQDIVLMASNVDAAPVVDGEAAAADEMDEFSDVLAMLDEGELPVSDQGASLESGDGDIA